MCTSRLPLSQSGERTKDVKRNVTSLLDLGSDSDEEPKTVQPSAKVAKGIKKKKKQRETEES